jgi:hypothetical protein
MRQIRFDCPLCETSGEWHDDTRKGLADLRREWRDHVAGHEADVTVEADAYLSRS